VFLVQVIAWNTPHFDREKEVYPVNFKRYINCVLLDNPGFNNCYKMVKPGYE
jgi:hypothetical protein